MLIGRLNRPRKPQVTVDTSLPNGWDAVASETPVDSAALVTALVQATVETALASGHYIIELDKDTTYTGKFFVDNGGANESQRITITGTPTGGTFTLSFDGQGPTAGISFDATAIQVQLALQGLSNISAGDVFCSGGPLPGTTIEVKFIGSLGITDVAEMTANGSGLTGGASPDAAITTLVEGRVGYAGTNWVIFRTSGHASLPAVGRRVTTGETNLAAILTDDTDPAMRVELRGHHVLFIGIDFQSDQSTSLLILLGHNSGFVVADVQEDMGHHVGFQRCRIRSTSESLACKQGIVLAINNFYCVDSRIENIKHTSEAQAILVNATDGPIHIENNFLEAAGEVIQIGGNDLAINEQIPKDITICRNHFSKPDKWNEFSPSFNNQPDATGWKTKNIFEIKMAVRVYFWGNILEYNWRGDQTGFAVLLHVKNQDGGNNWVRLEDILIENCVIRRSGRAFSLLSDDPTPDPDLGEGSGEGEERITIRNCLIHTIGGEIGDIEDFNVTGRLMKIAKKTLGTPVIDLLMDHCTFVFQEGHLGIDSFKTDADPIQVDGFTLVNSIFDDGNFETLPGKLDTEIINHDVSGNGIFFNPAATSYSTRINNGTFAASWPNNTKADTIALVKFTDNANQDYMLQSDSPFKGAANDGKDCGVDFTKLNSAIAGVE